MVHQALTFVHLLGFAAYIGAGFAQQQFVTRSGLAGISTAVRDDCERLAAAIVTKIELPAILVQVATGVAFVALTPAWLQQGWLHGKLGCVLLLLVLSHVEMFNARAIVKARAAQGEAANLAIAARRKRHAALGAAGTLAVVALLALVAYGIG